jgi:uncharacterized protein
VSALLYRTRESPLLARVLPFAVFLILTSSQGIFGDASRYWIYAAKTLVGAWLVWAVWPVVAEMRWHWSWEAVLVGVGVFGLWVGLDGRYPSLDELNQRLLRPALQAIGLGRLAPGPGASAPWNPWLALAGTPALALAFIAVRLVGVSLVVPPLEEVFYRSFLYRYLVKPDFSSVPLGSFHWTAFLGTSAVFGFTHREWLAGILCGFAYQGLVCWTKRLGDAMTAHAITNLLLGLWVVWKGAWQFW